jgi:hypothetical protein
LKVLLLLTRLPVLAPPDPVQLPLLPQALVSASPLAAACLLDSEVLQPVLVDPHPQVDLDSLLAVSLAPLFQASLDVEAPPVDPLVSHLLLDLLPRVAPLPVSNHLLASSPPVKDVDTLLLDLVAGN